MTFAGKDPRPAQQPPINDIHSEGYMMMSFLNVPSVAARLCFFVQM